MINILKLLLFVLILLGTTTNSLALSVGMTCPASCSTRLIIDINLIPLLVFFMLFGLVTYFIRGNKRVSIKYLLYVFTFVPLYYSFQTSNYISCGSGCSASGLFYIFSYLPNLEQPMYSLLKESNAILYFIEHVYLSALIGSFILYIFIMIIGKNK